MLRILPNNVLLCACGMCVSNEYYYILEIVYEKYIKYIGILIGTLTWNCNVFTVCVVCVHCKKKSAVSTLKPSHIAHFFKKACYMRRF